MKQHYRFISCIILGVIALTWIIFLIINEPDGSESKAIRDAAESQIKEAKENAIKIAEAEKATSSPAQTITPTEEVTPTPIEDETITPSPTPLVFPEYTKFDYIIANVTDCMNVRAGADQSKKVVGTLYANGYGKVIERGTEWFKIKSGDVTGYVSTQYILTDTDAINKIRELGALKIKVTGDDVNIRTEANTTCEVKLQAKNGTVYDYYPEFSTQLFYAIMVDEQLCFVSTSYSEVYITLDTAVK